MTISETIDFKSDISECFDGIIKSSEDKREYKALVLRNGLKVLLISDVDTDKSAAALDVNVGSMCDPREVQGLAHFLEHMLFLGTEKFPEENDYDQYISRNGGDACAGTGADHTNYYFDISTDHLSDALDRFAQFFIKPLLTESATEREMNAVHSEHERNIDSDVHRYYQLKKTLSDASHDFNKFNTGNIETLKQIPLLNGIDVREALLMFHERWYSANIMSLVVLGKETMEELLKMVVPLFAQIANTGITGPEWTAHPHTDECLRKQTLIVPIKDMRTLNMTFPTPDLEGHYKSKPGKYLTHLLGHEGSGSLLSELKQRGWSSVLYCFCYRGAKGFDIEFMFSIRLSAKTVLMKECMLFLGFFRLYVDLTEEGIDRVDQIIAMCFQYINLLKKAGPQQWMFEECKRINELSFQYKGKERPINYVKTLASFIHRYPFDDILCAGYQWEEYRPELITDVLNLLTPDRVRVVVEGKKFTDVADRTERWYGVRYALNDIPEPTLNMWHNCGLNDKLTLPVINDFIPMNMNLKARDVGADETPQMIRNSVLSRVWYLQDNRYLERKAYYFFQLTNPLVYLDPFHENVAHLFTQLFRDSINECLYGAELAGLHYSLSNTPRGLILEVGGYNDKLNVLLNIVLDKIIDFKIDEKRFHIIKEKYIRGLTNYPTRAMHHLLEYYTTIITSERWWSYEELLETAPDMTVENVSQIIRQMLSRLHIEALIHGNIEMSEALEVCDSVENQLKTRLDTRPIALSQQHQSNREVQLADGQSYCFETTNAIHKTNAIEVYFQFGVQETVSNVSLELLQQLLKEPFYNRLRTQEQLGYLVWASIRSAFGVQGISFTIESDCLPSYHNQRIEAFISWTENYINDMSDEVFEAEKQSLITHKLEKPKQLYGYSWTLWQEIRSKQYNFNRDHIEVNALKLLTKQSVIELFRKQLFNESSTRKKLSVSILGVDAFNETKNRKSTETEDLFPAPELKELMKIEDMAQFRDGLGLYPLSEPMIDVYKLDKS